MEHAMYLLNVLSGQDAMNWTQTCLYDINYSGK